MTRLDRVKAAEALTRYHESGQDPSMFTATLDRLEDCIMPGTSRVDVRVVTEAEQKLARIRELCDEPREWDERDADGCEARSARAYNSALADVAQILRGES